MATENQEELLALGGQVVERARKAGADVAEAVVSEGSHLSTKVRLGEPSSSKRRGAARSASVS